MIKLNLNKKELEEYSKKYNGMMVCSCGAVGCYFNFSDDLRWTIHKLFCKKEYIKSPKEIKLDMIKEIGEEKQDD